MLGKHDFDNNKKWDQIIIPKHLHEIATQIINTNKKITQGENVLSNYHIPNYPLSTSKQATLAIIIEHNKFQPRKPLYMIIQGTNGIGNSYLIHYIRNAINNNGQPQK